MLYIDDSDLAYIRQKYHANDGSFNNFSRFICHDGEYDMSTGLNATEMARQLREYVDGLTDTAHAVVKAKAVAFVLGHTPIDVNPGDYFVGIHSIDRVIGPVLTRKWDSEVFNGKIPEVRNKLNLLRADGATNIWPDYDHSVPDYDYILPLGFPGMLKKAREARAAHGSLTAEETAFFDSIEIELTAILALLDRFIDYSEKHPNAKSETVRAALRSLRSGAPKSVYETLLFIYIYFMCSEHVELLQVRSLSNIDRVLYPYYRADLESGRFTEDEIRMFIAYFYMQFAAIDNYWGQPVYFGGTKRDGTTEINELSYILLDVYDKMGIFNPKLQIKLSANTPREFVDRALDMIRRGHNSIVFVSEDFIRASLLRAGFSEEDARTADVKGCYEFSPPQMIGSAGIHLNLAKPVEYVFFNGVDPKSGRSIGVSLGEPEDFDTFEKFLSAYFGYCKYIVDEGMKAVNVYEDYYGYVNPMPLLSSTYRSSLASARDAYSSGARAFQTHALVCFLGSAADSLAMVKKYIYDTKTVSISEMKDALAKNFEGYETLRMKLLRDREKYGNNLELPDGIAKRVAETVASYIDQKPDGKLRGGKWEISLHCARQYIDLGKRTGATPDGRLRGEELSKNASPAQGCGYGGATASVLSLTGLDTTLFRGDLPLDVSMHPTAVRGEEGLAAMRALLEAYRLRGGHAIHFNILDGETLRAAQESPEKYPDLQIRVCGWNALFNSMDKNEQDSYILQAEAY